MALPLLLLRLLLPPLLQVGPEKWDLPASTQAACWLAAASRPAHAALQAQPGRQLRATALLLLLQVPPQPWALQEQPRRVPLPSAAPLSPAPAPPTRLRTGKG